MYDLIRLFIWLCCALPLGLGAQAAACVGLQYAQMHRVTQAEDIRLTCIVSYTGSDILVGGTVGGDIILSRHDAIGNLRWRTTFATGSESTELTTLNALLIEGDGSVAGIGSTYNDGEQFAYLFRYDVANERLLYYRRATAPSDPTDLAKNNAGDYLVIGARQDFGSPFFSRAFFQSFRPADGQPLPGGLLLDVDGDDKLYNLLPHPDGGFWASGQLVKGGGAGAIRASLSHLDETGRSLSTQLGPFPEAANARLYGYDIERIGNTLYLLQWGDIGVLSGSTNTSPLLTAFDLDGTPRWTRRYDLAEYPGETAINMAVHEGGLLLYGYALGGERDIFLLQIAPNGQTQWAHSYVFPGRVLLYPRAKQQFHATPQGINLVATYTFSGTRPHEALLLQLDAQGNRRTDCVNQRELTVRETPIAHTWRTVDLLAEAVEVDYPSREALPTAAEITAYDDCDIPCDRCSGQGYELQYLCTGDSAFVAGQWRTTSGRYLDTISVEQECDSTLTTELAFLTGPTATYTQQRGCGLPSVEVNVTVTSGVPPYSYSWSDPSISGSRPVLRPGDYQVTITDAANCQPFVLAVRVAPADQALSFTARPPTCPGAEDGAILLTPTGSGSLKLVTDTLFTQDSIGTLAPGYYSVIIRTTSGCEVFRGIEVPAATGPRVELRGPRQAELGQEVTYRAEIDSLAIITDYQWSPATASGCTNCPDHIIQARGDTVVRVTVTDLVGCTASDSLEVQVRPGLGNVFIPSAFSPNNDGTNDEWVPGLGNDIAMILSWDVYDRWGNLVWQYDPVSVTYWTGGDAGAGVYVYTATLQLIDGTRISRRGEVLLLR